MTHVIRAAALKGYREVMQQHGVSVPPLLEKFGLTPAALDEDNTLLPMDNVARLLEASSLAAACPDMGLQMARHQTLGALGMLGFVIKTASSAAEVTDIVTRFMSLQGSALRLRLDPPGPLVPGAFSIMLWIKGARPEDSRQVIDLLLGKAFQIGRLRAPWRAKVRAVSLPHDLAGNTDSHRQFFGVPVHVNQPVAALHLDSAGWNRPDPDHDPLYRQVNITALEPAYSTPSQLVSDRVRWALRPLIGTQRPTEPTWPVSWPSSPEPCTGSCGPRIPASRKSRRRCARSLR